MKSPVTSRGGMVATSQVAAVDAGLAMLERGGNAADAAVAAAAALAVTEPCSNGLGGDCFALHYEAEGGAVTALNGSGRAPAELTLDRLHEEGIRGTEMPPFHAHTVTAPGAVRGWFDLLERHGRLSMPSVLEPAIRLAADGFEVGEVTSYFWKLGAALQLRYQTHGRELLLEGRGPESGERFQNPTLARTLEEIAAEGPDAFYGGRVAAAIARAVAEAGGVLSEEDLAGHASTWDDPISTVFRGVRVHECPPNGQGLVALLALDILSALGADRLGEAGSAARIHTVIEAIRLAFSDGLARIADPRAAEVPIEELLDPGYARTRAAEIDPRRAHPHPPPRRLPGSGADTVYLTAVDGEGNACSFIQSNYQGFGTGIVPEGCGFTLQNRGACFSLDPAHPNAVAPGKRPYHTIIPALATRESDGSLYASFGIMGGFMQPQGQVQLLLALLEDGLDPQAALDRPRVYVEPRHGYGEDVAVEEGTPEGAVRELRDRGHDVRVLGGWERARFGRGQIILRDPGSGELTGGSDPRADGCARGR